MCRQLEMECTMKSITVSKCSYTFQKFLPNLSLLGTFTKLQRVAISFVMSVLSPWTTWLLQDGFSRYLIFENFLKNLSRKMKFHYNQKRITGPLHGGWCTSMTLSQRILGRMRNVQKIKIYILCSINFFLKNHAIYEIMSENMVQSDV